MAKHIIKLFTPLRAFMLITRYQRSADDYWCRIYVGVRIIINKLRLLFVSVYCYRATAQFGDVWMLAYIKFMLNIMKLCCFFF